MDKDRNRLGREIHKLRKNLELNQAGLAAKLGVTAMSVSRWEAGANEPPAECIVKMGVLSEDPKVFWSFLGHIGLTKKGLTSHL